MKNVVFVRICVVGSGTPQIREGEVLFAGGKPGWAALPNPRIGRTMVEALEDYC